MQSYGSKPWLKALIRYTQNLYSLYFIIIMSTLVINYLNLYNEYNPTQSNSTKKSMKIKEKP